MHLFRILAMFMALTILISSAGGAVVAQPAFHVEDEINCSYPINTTDATGTEIELDNEPDRIVTLWPSAAQPLWHMDAEDRVVGVTQWAGYLEGTDEKTNISASGGGISTERVVALEPDLVIAAHITDEEIVSQLRDIGITVYQMEEAESINDVYANIHELGELVGNCDEATATINWMEETIAEIEAAVEDEEPPGALYVSGFEYGPGENTYAHEIIETAGGENVLADHFEGWELVSDEIVIDEDPNWIVLNDRSPQVPESVAYEETSAVQEEQVVVVAHPHINQPGPRSVYAMVTLANAFHDAGIEVERPADWDHSNFLAEQGDEQEVSLGTSAVFGVSLAVMVVLLGGILYWRR